MLRSLAHWLYDRDPLESLRFEDSLARLRKRIGEDDRYLPELIRRHLLENRHRTTVVLRPDEKRVRARSSRGGAFSRRACSDG